MFNKIKSMFASKSHNSIDSCGFVLPGMQYSNFKHLSPSEAVDIYGSVSPVADAINKIVKEIKTIEPKVKDTKNDVFLDTHPILDLLDNPNTNKDYSSFIEEFSLFLLITGNTFTVASGPVNRPPSSVTIIPSQDISIESSSKDGMAKTYRVNGGGRYTRSDNVGLSKESYRFFLEGGGPFDEAEMWQTKLATPFSGVSVGSGSSTALYGLSPLATHYYDIQLYTASSVHNISILERGGLPSLILSMKNSMSEDQFEQLQKQLDRFQNGPTNAGRKMLVEGGEIEITQLQSDSRDMDFESLRKEVTTSLFRAYDIPAPLMNEDTMSFNNLEVARTMFYEASVLNNVDFIFSQLTLFLMGRYPNSENLIITYDRNNIPELAPGRINMVKTQSELGVYSINEIRKLLDLDPAAGGDDLYKPASEVPIATTEGDFTLSDNSSEKSLISLYEKSCA